MNLQLNADRFSGTDYVKLYDKYRPKPPQAILQQSLNYINQVKADTVLDLGCGTGLSTLVWQPFAKQAIGIEPSEGMITIAKEKATEGIKFQQGFAHDLPLEDQSVDIVSCSQAFHWMEPVSSLKEINRLLKPNGLLVLLDVVWPPSFSYEYEVAYTTLFNRVDQISKELNETIAHRWSKDQHLHNVQASNYFSYLKESYFHQTIAFDPEQLLGVALSQGGLEALIRRGFSEEEIGLKDFRKVIESLEKIPYPEIHYNYKVIFARK